MLKYALVDGLLDNLENSIFEDGGGGYGAGSGVDDLADKRISAKGRGYSVGSAFDEGSTDEGKRSKEDGVAVADVGEGHGVVVCMGRGQ